MNISKAKKQIKNAITAYLTRDDLGNYEIPVEKQRPLLLIGPPGIGKTAIMEQLASEMGIGLISYSMTHHTRQSAIGLPFISHRSYGGKEYDVTEYTMSEIIASVYELMESTGVKEGILFLDEINCVSETLAPLMLQFLQYKVFGGHRLPDGWVIVTAGNPPEYNESARDFDAVTLDRMKKIIVEPDFEAWTKYAISAGVHPAIMAFLQSKKNRFYYAETTAEGKLIVTPRGWEDLSKMLQLYEKNELEVDEDLISQYLQEPKTAREFAVYYDLYNKYKSEYPIDDILEGKFIVANDATETEDESEDGLDFKYNKSASSRADDEAEDEADARITTIAEEPTLADILVKNLTGELEKEASEVVAAPVETVNPLAGIIERSSKAGFDEVYTLIGLLISTVTGEVGECEEDYKMLESVRSCIRKWATEVENGGDADKVMADIIERLQSGRDAGLKAKTLSREESNRILRSISVLQEMEQKIKGLSAIEQKAEVIRNGYSERVRAHKAKAGNTQRRMGNMFKFAEKCWGEGKEMLMIVTEMTADPDSVRFISRHGCGEYFKHNKNLMFSERELELDKEIDSLDV